MPLSFPSSLPAPSTALWFSEIVLHVSPHLSKFFEESVLWCDIQIIVTEIARPSGQHPPQFCVQIHAFLFLLYFMTGPECSNHCHITFSILALSQLAGGRPAVHIPSTHIQEMFVELAWVKSTGRSCDFGKAFFDAESLPQLNYTQRFCRYCSGIKGKVQLLGKYVHTSMAFTFYGFKRIAMPWISFPLQQLNITNQTFALTDPYQNYFVKYPLLLYNSKICCSWCQRNKLLQDHRTDPH